MRSAFTHVLVSWRIASGIGYNIQSARRAVLPPPGSVGGFMTQVRDSLRLGAIALASLVLIGRPSKISAQADVPVYQTDFPPEEFKARWAKIYDQIGPTAVAVVQG